MNFARVVRMAIRYKFTFAASIVSALMVAVFWGANIGAVYPVVEVVLQDHSMQQWVDGRDRRQPSGHREEIGRTRRIREQLAAAREKGDRTFNARSARLEAELDAEDNALETWVPQGKAIHRQVLAATIRFRCSW